MKSSRYNIRIPTDGGGLLLYNVRTGAVLDLSGPDATELANELTRAKGSVVNISVSDTTRSALLAGGFLADDGFDELQAVSEVFWTARRDTPLVFTITTTLDCNLGCFYCYEERSGAALAAGDVDAIVQLAAERLCQTGKPSLHVDWYGGEPLLNAAFLEDASLALQKLCRGLRVRYSSSVISNGTRWPADAEAFVRRHKIRQVQISFDGLRDRHERQRRFRSGYRRDGEPSSFDQAVAVVDRLSHVVQVDVRLNISRMNLDDVLPFLRFIESRGWFDRPFPVVIQPARLADYSERSSFMREAGMSPSEFDAVKASIEELVANRARIEESEVPDGFPFPRTSVCAALAIDSVVVGADRQLFRCGLQVAEPSRAVGALPLANGGLPTHPGPGNRTSLDTGWWESFDPTTLPTCSVCSFLPVCWGGCPKRHLESDATAIAEQGRYWRTNIPRLVASWTGRSVAEGFQLSEEDQFPDRIPRTCSGDGEEAIGRPETRGSVLQP
jgi:uncharacterized protein